MKIRENHVKMCENPKSTENARNIARMCENHANPTAGPTEMQEISHKCGIYPEEGGKNRNEKSGFPKGTCTTTA